MYAKPKNAKHIFNLNEDILITEGYFEKMILAYDAHRFERPLYATGGDRQIECNPETAKFFWGEDGTVPDINTMNRKFGQDELEEKACPVRFSIGAILFERAFFEEYGYYKVDRS